MAQTDDSKVDNNDSENLSSQDKSTVKNDSNVENNENSETSTNNSESNLIQNENKKNLVSNEEKDEDEIKPMKRMLPDSSVLTGTSTFETPFTSIAKKVTSDSFFSKIEPNTSGKFKDTFENEDDDLKGNQFTIVTTSAFGEDDVQVYEGKCAKLAVFKSGEIQEWDQATMTHFYIIKNEKSGNHRLVCFQTGTGRVQLNTEINDTMKIQKLRDKIIIFMGRDTKNESVLVPYKMSFPDKCARDSFHDKLLSYSNTG